MQTIKAIIFDIDGTLANTVPLCIQAFRLSVEPLINRSLSDKEITSSFGPDEEGAVKAFAPDDYKKGTSDFLRHYAALHDMCPDAFDGIAALLQKLKTKGVRLAIATGKAKFTSQLSLERFGLTDYFEVIENGSPEGSRKIESIQQIINSFSNISKEETLYVGDSAADIKESREAGVFVVAAAWAETANAGELKKEKPDALFTTVSEFENWILEHL